MTTGRFKRQIELLLYFDTGFDLVEVDRQRQLLSVLQNPHRHIRRDLIAEVLNANTQSYGHPG